jgi:rhomboid protease GluP
MVYIFEKYLLPAKTLLMFQILLKKYLFVFFTSFSGCIFINWLISTQVNLKIDEDYLDLWFPILVCCFVTYFILRPIVKKMHYKERAADFLLWFIIPFTIYIPIAFSQKWFKNISFKMILIDKPSDLYHFPNERFFKIKSFAVMPEDYFVVKERHSSGKNGTTLDVSNYYITPVYDDTSKEITEKFATVGYGVKFYTSMHNGFFDKKINESFIKDFNQKSSDDYKKYEFYKVDYFEKIENNNDAEYFSESIQQHNNFDKSANCLIIVNRSGTLKGLFDKGKEMFLYSTLICLSIGLFALFLVNLFSDKKSNS